MTPIDSSAVQQLADRVEALGEFSETVDRVIATKKMTFEEYRAWRNITLPTNISEIRLTTPEGDPLDDEVFDGDVRVMCQVDVRKAHSDTHVCFISVSGFERFLRDDPRAANVQSVSNARQRSHFASTYCDFGPWHEHVSEKAARIELSPDPRRYVRDLSSSRLVPTSILDAIAKQIPPDEGDVVWQIWSRYAMDHIALALASEVLPGPRADSATLSFRSKRVTSVLLEAGEIGSAAFHAANDLATWVYIEGNDVETRHILVGNAISDEWADGRTWADGIASFGPLALEAAKSGYQLHLADVSSDALKALGDLRKSLYDDIPKMLQQTRDLTNGLWRDFAVVIAVVLTQLSHGPTTLLGRFTLERSVLWSVAVYLIASAAIVLLTAHNFRRIEEDAREAWLERVYRFIGSHERDALAKTPYTRASRVFTKAMWSVTGSYLVLVIVLVLLGLSSAPARVSPAKAAASPAPNVRPSNTRATPPRPAHPQSSTPRKR